MVRVSGACEVVLVGDGCCVKALGVVMTNDSERIRRRADTTLMEVKTDFEY